MHNRHSIMAPPAAPRGTPTSDAVLLSLEEQFVAIAAQVERKVNCVREGLADEALMKEAEDVLARLAPIERAIMETPAYTITGLSVKARHVAYVLSECWQAPIDQIDWEGRAVRLLIESICNIADTPLLLIEEGASRA
jgi:hypothetical protein